MNHISKKFFTGINYWGSGNAINMWEQFDAASIETDLKLLSSVGITHLRVFPLWPIFQPLHAVYGPNHVYEYAFGESPLPDTPAGKAGVSEEACQHFQTFCQLAEQYGILASSSQVKHATCFHRKGKAVMDIFRSSRKIAHKSVTMAPSHRGQMSGMKSSFEHVMKLYNGFSVPHIDFPACFACLYSATRLPWRSSTNVV